MFLLFLTKLFQFSSGVSQVVKSLNVVVCLVGLTGFISIILPLLNASFQYLFNFQIILISVAVLFYFFLFLNLKLTYIHTYIHTDIASALASYLDCSYTIAEGALQPLYVPLGETLL